MNCTFKFFAILFVLVVVEILQALIPTFLSVSKIGFSIKRKEKIMSDPSMSFIAEKMHESNLNVPDPVKAYFYLISGVCF